MHFCNQTLNISSSSLLILYTPPVNSACCNLTVKSDYSEQMMINIYNITMKDSPLKIANKQNELIKFTDFSSSNRIYWKSDSVSFPISLSLCQNELPTFEILINDPTKGSSQNKRKTLFLGNQVCAFFHN